MFFFHIMLWAVRFGANNFCFLASRHWIDFFSIILEGSKLAKQVFFSKLFLSLNNWDIENLPYFNILSQWLQWLEETLKNKTTSTKQTKKKTHTFLISSSICLVDRSLLTFLLCQFSAWKLEVNALLKYDAVSIFSATVAIKMSHLSITYA